MIAVAIPVGASPAWADDVGGDSCSTTAIACERSDVDFLYRDAIFDGFEYDTGWIPNNSGVQIRLALRVLGETEVEMGGEGVTSWPDALTVAIPGRAGTGRLEIGYGVELIARIRINVEVLGNTYTWEGDIPDLLGQPTDLLMAGANPFDPFLLPGDFPRPVSVSDATDRITVYTYDITGGLIDIPGITGEVRVDLQGSLTSTYQTESIAISNGPPITMSGGTSSQAPGPQGFGPAADYTVQPNGTLTHDGTITLYPHVEVTILGVTVIDQDLLAIPIPLVDSDSSIAFDPAAVHAPLPDVSFQPATVDIVGSQGVLLEFHNGGERVLQIELVSHPGEVSLDSGALTIPPGGDASRGVRLDPALATTSVDVSGTLVFSTDDPDTPRLEIPITVSNVSTDPDPNPNPDPDPNPIDGDGAPAGGCGCGSGTGTGTGSGLAVLFAAMFAVLGRRRRQADHAR